MLKIGPPLTREVTVERDVPVRAPDGADLLTDVYLAGAQIVQQRWEAPPGPGVRLRHPDGLLAEYLEHRPSADDVGEPGPELR
jgi:hypothetical protein